MTIAPMKKVTLCGPEAEKAGSLAALQELGVMHVAPVGAPSITAHRDGGEAHEIRSALAHLQRAPHLRRPLRRDPAFDIRDVSQRALANRDRQRELREQRDTLRSKIAHLKPWGDFRFPDPGALGGYLLWFYEVPHRKRRDLDRVTLPWVEVARSPSTHYIVVIAKEQPPGAMMPAPRSRTGSTPLTDIERQLEETELELDELEQDQVMLTRYILLIKKNLARADDAAALARAAAEARDQGGVFAVGGWVPDDRLDEIWDFAEARRLALLVTSPGSDEVPPTRLDNPMPAAAGEDLTHFYQVPSPRDWDPSGVLVASFALFFAMILSDAGYGAIVVLAAFAFWRRLGSAAGRRVRVLMLILGVSAVAYGAIVGSYFGLAPPAGSILSGLVLFDARDPDVMMPLAVGIGVSHVVLGLAAAAWRAWPDRRALASLAWILVAVGGFAAWRGQASAVADLRMLGFGAIAVGLLGVLLFQGSEKAGGVIGFLKRSGAGLMGLGQLPKLFGDVLSYLRLFALGLASASLAVTFNGLAADVAGSVGGLGLLLAILIVLVGHGLNFTLALVGGIVHGMRLNFIEFYNWSLTEEGYPYRPLERKESRL